MQPFSLGDFDEVSHGQKSKEIDLSLVWCGWLQRAAIPPIAAWGSQLHKLRSTLDSETSVEFAEADTENSRALQNINSWDFFSSEMWKQLGH